MKSDLHTTNPPTLVNNVATTRAGNVFSYRLPISIGSSAAEWLSVSIKSSGGTNPIANAQTLGNRYIAPTNQSPTYDADGNLASDGRWSYRWDAENRLISMETQQTTAVNVGVPRQKLEFGYDSRSRRVMKRVYSGAGTGANITWTLQSDVRFVYHGWNLMAEVEMIPTATDAPRRTLVQAQMPYVRRSYMWGPDMSGTLDGAGGVGGLLAMRRHERGTQSTETFWATHDLNGNVIGLVQLPVTGCQPAKMAVYDYDPSGQLTRVNEPEANFNPIRFSSKYTDSETGLVYYGHRYLSPELGRWISRDPIEEAGGINLYGMVGNDLVNTHDMLGCFGIARGAALSVVRKFGSSRLARTTGIDRAARRLMALGGYTEKVAPMGSGSGGHYSRLWREITFPTSSPDEDVALHELVHVYNHQYTSIGGITLSARQYDEGMAYAIQSVYRSAVWLKSWEDRAAAKLWYGDLTGKKLTCKNEAKWLSVEWPAFWGGLMSSNGFEATVAFGFDRQINAIDDSNLLFHLKAGEKCGKIIKIMNRALGQCRYCKVRLSCKDDGPSTDIDGTAIIYTGTKLPAYKR